MGGCQFLHWLQLASYPDVSSSHFFSLWMKRNFLFIDQTKQYYGDLGLLLIDSNSLHWRNSYFGEKCALYYIKKKRATPLYTPQVITKKKRIIHQAKHVNSPTADPATHCWHSDFLYCQGQANHFSARRSPSAASFFLSQTGCHSARKRLLQGVQLGLLMNIIWLYDKYDYGSLTSISLGYGVLKHRLKKQTPISETAPPGDFKR